MVYSFYRVFAIKVLLSIKFYQASLKDENARRTASCTGFHLCGLDQAGFLANGLVRLLRDWQHSVSS